MRCPSCRHDNPPDRPACEHCGNDLGTRPARSDLVASVLLWVMIVAALAGGGWVTIKAWPRSASATAEPGSYTAPVAPPTEPGPSASPTQDVSAQFTAMNTLLQDIKNTRSSLPDTLGSCSSLDSDLTVLQQVVPQRQDQANSATNLRTDQMTDGGALEQALTNMTQSTLTADRDYLDWAQQAQSSGNCSDAGQDGTIGTDNQTAADAKRNFVKLWNADAARFGQPQYSWKDF